ncbi:MAG: hypothetical protein WCL50_16715, partial [Spirochaetota bacterium]
YAPPPQVPPNYAQPMPQPVLSPPPAMQQPQPPWNPPPPAPPPPYRPDSSRPRTTVEPLLSQPEDEEPAEDFPELGAESSQDQADFLEAGESEADLPEYIEAPEVEVDDDDLGEDSSGVELEESEEHPWDDGNETGQDLEEGRPEAPGEAEQAPRPKPPGSGSAPEGSAPAEPTPELPLSERALKLFEYLKGLSAVLPEEQREEFESSGVKDKLDGLIENLTEETVAHGAPELPQGLRAKGDAARARAGAASKLMQLRPADPRREKSTRRSGGDRRNFVERREPDRDRREKAERRAADERRDPADRRFPPPKIELPSEVVRGIAHLKYGDDGAPFEVAGIRISPKLARLLEIVRKGKDRGN